MTRFAKILALVLSVVILLMVLGVVAVLVRLPSLSELGQMVGRRATPQTETVPVTPQTRTALPSPLPSPPPGTLSRADQQAVDDYVFRRYFSESATPTVAVCANLSAARDPTDSGIDAFNTEFARVAKGEKPGDPYIEAILAPLGQVLRRRDVRELIVEAKQALDRGDTSFVTKAEFYSKAALVTADLMANRAQIEHLSDNAYLLYMLTRTLRERPGLLDDPTVMDLCESLQKDALNPNADFKKNRALFQEFLDDEGVDAETIGYDPNYESHIEIVRNSSGINMKVPWMEEVFANSGETLTAFDFPATPERPRVLRRSRERPGGLARASRRRARRG